VTPDEKSLSPMKDLAVQPAEWVGHGLAKRSYELRSDSETFATLRWETAFGSRATARTRAATWTLKRIGFFNPKVTVRAPEVETDLAVYHPDWIGNGRVELPGGRTWRWKCLGFWRSKYGFTDESGEPLIEYHANTLKLPATAKLVVTPRALALAEFSLLVVLGWYVTVLTFDDMMVAAAG
jgi:hypothetical protein